MNAERTKAETQEAMADIYYGQIVFIWARWFVIVGALFLILWKAEDVQVVQRSLIPLALIMVANLFLHGRLVMRQPVNAMLLTVGSVVDIVFVTLVIILGGAGVAGINNPFFVLYYPVVLASSLVFPRNRTIALVGTLLVLYGAICILIGPGVDLAAGDERILAVRLVTIAVTALLGTKYWRIQRTRRRADAA